MIDRSTIRLATAICMLCSAFGFAAEATAADRATAADIVGGNASSRDIRPIFEQFDENRDQRIDRTEFRVWIVGAYEMLDSNRDERLTRAEVPSVGSSDFNKADQNNDGGLSAFEFVDSDLMKFARFDLNRDGFITYEEVIASRRK
jgi:Ca2+-binding EF-hand superfamily protein